MMGEKGLRNIEKEPAAARQTGAPAGGLAGSAATINSAEPDKGSAGRFAGSASTTASGEPHKGSAGGFADPASTIASGEPDKGPAFNLRKPELLAPGGDLSKALTALEFGADAVYIGGRAFGLRAAAGNFSSADIDALLAYARPRGRKVYVTLNILPRTKEVGPMAEYARELYEQGVDGVIAADIGAVAAIRRTAPGLPVHISTQANTLNAETCRFWASLGASRINLARELSLAEITEIASDLKNSGIDNVPELEVFVHGAMCMAYSGRCMLSDFLTGRSSNRGECAQPCRWQYTLDPAGFSDSRALPDTSAPYILSANMTEAQRPGQVFGVEESERGTFLFNSRDLCLLPYLADLIRAGASALKIEGRMKSEYYVGVTVRAYREAIDLVWSDLLRGGNGSLPPSALSRLLGEVCSVSHREYYDGFLNGGNGVQIYGSSSYIRSSTFVGIVESCEPDPSGAGFIVTVSQRGNFGVGESVDFVMPSRPVESLLLTSMTDGDGNPIVRAPHPCMTVRFTTPFSVERGALLRRNE